MNPEWLTTSSCLLRWITTPTLDHIFWELQLLLFTGLGFFLMLKHLRGQASASVDADWLYQLGPELLGRLSVGARSVVGLYCCLSWAAPIRLGESAELNTWWPGHPWARAWTIGETSVWVVLLLGLYGLVYLAL